MMCAVVADRTQHGRATPIVSAGAVCRILVATVPVRFRWGHSVGMLGTV